MSDEQRQELIDAKVEKDAKAIEVRKAAEIKAGFLNPFGEKTTYAEFSAELEKSKKSIAEYCKVKITKEKIEWLENELSIFKK